MTTENRSVVDKGEGGEGGEHKKIAQGSVLGLRELF